MIFFSTGRSSVTVTPAGRVEARRAGEHTVVALLPSERLEADVSLRGVPGIRFSIPVKVTPSPLARLEFGGVPARLHVGAVVPMAVTGTDVNQNRQDVRAELTVSDPSIAKAVSFGPTFQGSTDAHPQYRRPQPELFPSDATGILTALAPGKVTVTATTAEGVSAQMELRIDANPARSLELTASRDEARTGDVIHFEAVARDGEQRPLRRRPSVTCFRPGPIRVGQRPWGRGRRRR